jgi:hypothetical protein
VDWRCGSMGRACLQAWNSKFKPKFHQKKDTHTLKQNKNHWNKYNTAKWKTYFRNIMLRKLNTNVALSFLAAKVKNHKTKDRQFF